MRQPSPRSIPCPVSRHPTPVIANRCTASRWLPVCPDDRGHGLGGVGGCRRMPHQGEAASRRTSGSSTLEAPGRGAAVVHARGSAQARFHSDPIPRTPLPDAGSRPGPGGPAKAWARVIHSEARSPWTARSVSTRCGAGSPPVRSRAPGPATEATDAGSAEVPAVKVQDSPDGEVSATSMRPGGTSRPRTT